MFTGGTRPHLPIGKCKVKFPAHSTPRTITKKAVKRGYVTAKVKLRVKRS